jgi:glycosyltransferase involved in cell wall biosynthesis
MRSVLNTWSNLHPIDHWLVVDDNSSDEDRKAMREEFPWIRFVWKKPDQAGHRISMNIIFDELSRVRPEYWIHLEDDFLFHQKLDYIGQALVALDTLKDQNVS